MIYPLFIVGTATLIAPGNGSGETIEKDGKTVGFGLIGQSFTTAKYFNSRPSAVNYNAAATGGSNKGPNNPEYLKQVEERISNFLSENPGITKEEIPIDLITASGSGIDPHISLSAALVQIPRIAALRGLSVIELKEIVLQNTNSPTVGIFGPSTVQLLKLNIALDQLKK